MISKAWCQPRVLIHLSVLGLSILNITSFIAGKDRYQPNYHVCNIRGLDLNMSSFIVEKVSIWAGRHSPTQERGVGPSLEQTDDRRVKVVSMQGTLQLENQSYGNKRQAAICAKRR